jgi:hypothetical protein
MEISGKKVKHIDCMDSIERFVIAMTAPRHAGIDVSKRLSDSALWQNGHSRANKGKAVQISRILMNSIGLCVARHAGIDAQSH